MLLKIQLILVVWDRLGCFALLLRLIHGRVLALLLLMLHMILWRKYTIHRSKGLVGVGRIWSTAIRSHLRISILVLYLGKIHEILLVIHIAADH